MRSGYKIQIMIIWKLVGIWNNCKTIELFVIYTRIEYEFVATLLLFYSVVMTLIIIIESKIC